MGLMDKLRKAEEQGKQAARNAFERAKEMGEDAERRIRQKMRIYPPNRNHLSDEVNQSGAAAGVQPSGLEPAESEQTEGVPIVSIHGKDVRGAGKVA
jgi:hypothetical protein